MRTLLSGRSGVQHAPRTASCLHGKAQADALRPVAALVSTPFSIL